jgi:hypothetical protein
MGVSLRNTVCSTEFDGLDKVSGAYLFLGTGKYHIIETNMWLPLWSSGQRSAVRFPVLLDFLRSRSREPFRFYSLFVVLTVNIDNTVGAVGFIPRYAGFVYRVALIRVDETTGKPIRGKNGLCIQCEPGKVWINFFLSLHFLDDCMQCC